MNKVKRRVIYVDAGQNENKEFQIALYLVAYLLVGWDVVYKAIKNLIHGKV